MVAADSAVIVVVNSAITGLDGKSNLTDRWKNKRRTSRGLYFVAESIRAERIDILGRFRQQCTRCVSQITVAS